MDESANKNRRLKEAVQGVQFRRGVDDLNNWLYTTETRLANDDVGDDIPSVKQLLKKHKVEKTLIISLNLYFSCYDVQVVEH